MHKMEHSLSNMSFEETSRSHHQKITKLSPKCSTTAFTSKELNGIVSTDSITDHHKNTISNNAHDESTVEQNSTEQIDVNATSDTLADNNETITQEHRKQ